MVSTYDVTICFLKSDDYTSPGTSIGKAAKESITSDEDIATVFLSTTANPMS